MITLCEYNNEPMDPTQVSEFSKRRTSPVLEVRSMKNSLQKTKEKPGLAN